MEKADVTAIVYVSNTGRTARYARLLGERTGLPVYSLAEARRTLPRKCPILYCGWLMASHVKDYRKAARRFTVRALCGVGLCPTGGLIPEIRRADRLPDSLPLFTLQGGMDRTALTGIYGSMIDFLIRSLAKKQNPTPEEAGMLELLRAGGDLVAEENLTDVLGWYFGNEK